MAGKKQAVHKDILALGIELRHKLEASIGSAESLPAPHAKNEGQSRSSSVEKSFFNNRSQKPSKNFPKVSIVIPVYNKVDLTYRCLDSLSRSTSKYKYEVIIIDNASSDGTAELISSIPGLRYIRNPRNLGFVDGCNQGAKSALGETVVFLNNDTIVTDNWLDGLVDRLSDPSIGLVGSKLIYPDGVLQEAGGILFSDGSGNNYGKGMGTGDYLFNFARDTDYCSGASIAINRDFFLELDMFDRRYAPAYYEDSDLAMKVRRAGKRVVYEPRSVLIHVEGGTAGNDTSSGFKRFQPINRKKFIKKWQAELKKNHLPPSARPIEASWHGKPKRLLIIDDMVPEYDRDSGLLRMSQIIKAAQRLGYVVTFYPDNLVASQPYTFELQTTGVEVVYGKLLPEVVYVTHAGMFDAVILSRPLTAVKHIEFCRMYQPQAKLIFDTVDLHYLRVSRQAEVEKSKELYGYANDWKRIEYYLIEHADTTLVVSDVEQKILKKQFPNKKISILSNINSEQKIDHVLGFNDRNGLLFIGSYNHLPNRDGVSWFVKDIYKQIQKKLPDINLTLLGNAPTAEILRLASETISVPGFIEDVSPNFNSARVFVCPLRYGAGVKGKLTQALSLGLPIVSTSVGIEGMHMRDGIDCLVADTPSEFAKQVNRLYTDERLWNTIRNNAQKIYQEYFSEAAGLKALQNVLD